MTSSVSSSHSSSTNNVRHIRSISFPTRLHPAATSTLQVQEEYFAHLVKSYDDHAASTSSAATIESVCDSLEQLKSLYASVNDLLTLPQTQQSLLKRKDDYRFVDELLDRSVSLLDVCGFVKDVMEQVKEHIRNIRSAHRRGKLVDGVKISDTSSSVVLRMMMKDVKRAILGLKRIDNTIALLDLDDHHLSSLIRSLRDTCALTASIFGSLIMSFSSMFVSKPKATKWKFVSSLIRKGTSYEVQSRVLDHEADLENHIEVIEESLESMCRTLIRARVSLLNIRSH